MIAGHFHQFHLAIKSHHLDAMGRRILDLRNLLAGVGIDDSAWIHTQRLNQLNLRLEEEVTPTVSENKSNNLKCHFST